MENKMNKTLNLEWRTRGIVPTLLQGKDAQMLYNALPEKARVGLKYDINSKSVIGSTSFASAILDVEARKYGARTPNLRDLSRPEIMEITKGKYYIDSRNLVVRSPRDSDHFQNNRLLRQIYELAEDKEGNVKDGFMIEGFTFIPDENDKKGYGLKIVPLEDFKVIQDDRFVGHNGDNFSEVDEFGIPNFDKNGDRIWYAKSNGLSRLYLDRDLGLGSGNYNLGNSNDIGRVVLLK